MRKIAFVYGVLSILSSAFAAEEKAPSAPNEPVEVLREKTVYVPYDKLPAVFEKEGRGIFLPYEEFLRLWAAGQPRPPEPPPDGPPAAAVIRGGAYSGAVAGDVARLTASFEIEALKKGWSEVALPFRNAALETVKLPAGAVLGGKGADAAVYLPAPGRYEVVLTLSTRVAREPGKRTVSIGIPPVAVSRLDLQIPEENARVEVAPAVAVTRTSAVAGGVRVETFLGGSGEVAVSWMPPAEKAAEAAAVVFAEQSIRASLGERSLKVTSDISYRVIRGETEVLRVRAPEGCRVLSVKGEGIREWTQEGDLLTVKLHAPLKDSASKSGDGKAEPPSYRLALAFERILPETPPALAVAFPRAEGVAGESGWVVLSQDSGLRARVASSTGLGQLDRDEVPEPLRADLGLGFRYLAQPISLGLAIEKIVPSVKASTTSVIVLGSQEDVWVGWIDALIAKAGIFRIEFRVPARWSVASAGDPAAVEDVATTDGADGMRAVAVNLKSRAIGALRLPFKLTAPGSAAPGEATFAPPAVLGAEGDRGLLGVSAPKAIELTTAAREKMTPVDVDELFKTGVLGQVGADAGIPLTYGYREGGASVKVGLRAKRTEINVLPQHLVEITEGAIRLTHVLDYEILYAAADRLRFSAPSGLDTLLRVEAKEKKEVVKGASEGGRTTWEIVLQAPALGPVSVTVSHDVELKVLDPGKPFSYEVPVIRAADAREKSRFFAVRKESTLEVAPKATGMESIDPGDLPDKLRRGRIHAAFRSFNPEPTLSLTLTRYEFQPLASAVVNLVRLKSVLSEERRLKTEAVLFVQNADRQYLELKLPAEASVLSISVAGKPREARKRKDGAGTLIAIPPSAGAAGTFPVVVVYDEPLGRGPMGSIGRISLSTPEVLDGVPVAKIEMALFLDPEYACLGWGGSLQEAGPGSTGLWTRFKGLLNRAVGAPPPPPSAPQGISPAPPIPGATGVIDVEIPTRGFVERDFETLAPVGTLRFTYIDRDLYSFLDFLACVLAAAGGWLLVRRPGRGRIAAAVGLVFLPLVLVWFSEGAGAEIFTSILAGGALAFAILGVLSLRRSAAEWRAARLSLPPDPYLEGAPEPAKPKPAAPSPAPPPAGASGQKTQEPPKASPGEKAPGEGK
jgi:hypothetical protein